MTPEEEKLRDEFAIKILCTELSASEFTGFFWPKESTDYDDWAKDAYDFADAMMRARNVKRD